jgi:hypothetical protein
MSVKHFLKPNKWKVTIFAILMILSSLFSRYETIISFEPVVSQVFGFPFPIYIKYLPEPGSLARTPEISYEGFILNAIVWYFLSCFMIWIYEKSRNKSMLILISLVLTMFGTFINIF